MPYDLVAFAAIFFCGLALVPAAAHAMELPNKIGLAREEYLIAQKVYRGWQFVAPIVIVALISSAVLVSQAKGRRSEVASIVAFLCVAATQIVFWMFTFPVNRATRNWTDAPPNWEQLRRRWEYSHATSAAFNLVAFIAAALASLWS